MINGPPHMSHSQLTLHNLPVEIIAQIARLLDFQSILDLLMAEPLLSRHFIAVSNTVDDDGRIECGTSLVPGRPTLSLDAFLKSGKSSNHYLRLFYLSFHGNAYDRIIGWRSGVIPPEDRFFHAMLNRDAFVFFGRGSYHLRNSLATEQLLSQGVTMCHSFEPHRQHYMSWIDHFKMMPPQSFQRSRVFGRSVKARVTVLRLHAHLLNPDGPFAVAGVYLPGLRVLLVMYKDHIPQFLPGNTLGSLPPRGQRGGTYRCTELLFIHDECDSPTQTELTTRACYSTPDDLSQSDWSFTSNFSHLSVIGGPNSLIKHMNLSNTVCLHWKRASRQTFEDYDNFPTEIVAPWLTHFCFETLIANTVVPKINHGLINQFSRLGFLNITTRRPGLKFNNILRDHGSLHGVCLFNKVVPASHPIATQRSRKRRRTPQTPITLVQELKKSELARDYPFMTRFELHGLFQVDFDIRDFLGTIQTGAETYFPQTEDTGLRQAKRMKMLEGVAPWSALG